MNCFNRTLVSIISPLNKEGYYLPQSERERLINYIDATAFFSVQIHADALHSYSRLRVNDVGNSRKLFQVTSLAAAVSVNV
jgi:hypothetical protein